MTEVSWSGEKLSVWEVRYAVRNNILSIGGPSGVIEDIVGRCLMCCLIHPIARNYTRFCCVVVVGWP